MNLRLNQVCQQVQDDIDGLPVDFFDGPAPKDRSQEIGGLIEKNISSLQVEDQERVRQEFLGWGPLENLIQRAELTEIIVNGFNNIWFEKAGRLFQYQDHFFSKLRYLNCIHRLLEKTNKSLTRDRPFCDAPFFGFRLSFVETSITGGECALNLRRHSPANWDLEGLWKKAWCDFSSFKFLQNLIQERKNFLVLGATGSGKTSVVSALLKATAEDSRTLVIEDTSEIHLSKACDLRLLTSEVGEEGHVHIHQSELVRRALRLRPDRLVLGEIRGTEAKDFLMALSTGHDGSFGTLHANNPHQALLRLEMLIQMGSPQWSLDAIRRLISLSLQYLILTQKNSQGERKLEGIYKIHSLEETGFTLEKMELSTPRSLGEEHPSRLEPHSFLQ